MDAHARGDRIHMLYIPADDADKLGAAAASKAASLNIDLEDGVLPPRKADARRNTAALLEAQPEVARRSVVRVNELHTDWWLEDLAATIAHVQTYLIPKVSGPEDIAAVDAALRAAERTAGVPEGSRKIYAIVETAAAVIGVRELIAASPRITGVITGQADLTVDAGCEGIGEHGFTPSPMLEWAHAQVLFAVRAAGLPVLVSPWAPNGQPEFQVREMRRLFDLGYHGMVVSAISALDAVEEAWRPSPGQAAFARGALAAREEAAAAGTGVTSYQGWLIEGSYLQIAERLLARDERSAPVGAR
jgi:citrate lyase subunit beta / citryl-CoA lyase